MSEKIKSKICPYCAEEIEAEAVVCPYCGSDFLASALPPEDPRLSNMVAMSPTPYKPTLLEKVIRFLSRLFGG
jgi:hypothetical protein